MTGKLKIYIEKASYITHRDTNNKNVKEPIIAYTY